MEIFDHLITNAIKYSMSDTPPEITISAETQADVVKFSVQDRGIGIAPEHQDKIFDWFFRVRHARAYGFGIGLSVVRFLVKRMNGTYGIESVPGEDSTFWFTLPAEPVHKNKIAGHSHKDNVA
jgi:signal transduction histidine kinase